MDELVITVIFRLVETLKKSVSLVLFLVLIHNALLKL